jgi:hypothetical protein
MSRNSRAKRKIKKAKKTKKINLERDKSAKEKMKIPTIYLDESGNTGSNLLDVNQPVFTLASCIFSNEEAQNLLKLTGSNSPDEVHFKTLRRRKSGQDGIIRLLSNKIIKPKNIGINIIHKEFMIVTKIVDLLIEHMMHYNGEDLYLNGQNIALSNMLYYCLPAFCPQELVSNMYTAFISMIHEHTDEKINLFYKSLEILQSSSSKEVFKEDIGFIIKTRDYINDALTRIDKTSLDPSIPAFFLHCAKWGNSYPKGFHIVHDDSHSIANKRLLFAHFMDWTQDSVEVGYDRRKYKLPLKGKSLKFSSSKDYAQLQVADIIASSFTYWAAGINRNKTEDYLFIELQKLNLDKFIGHNKIWPTPHVTPEDLGTVHDGGVNSANYTPFFLQNSVPNPNIANT